MEFPLPIPPELRRALPPGTSVLVAVSGGVDSSVALALLSSLGCECRAVTFKNFCSGDAADLTGKSCCSSEAVDDAARVARLCGVRHWVTDVSELFRREVIDPFVSEYRSGRTPNPCLACNERVRFPELVRLSGQLGYDLVATGHYARMAPGDGGPRLMRGLDEGKDQSYFLSRLGRDLMPRVVFPLGWYRKDEIRRAARELGLPVAEKAESQEICFVPDGDRAFLFTGREGDPGEIVDGSGAVLGRHRGLEHYTVGQRRGLGVAAGEPRYVLALDVERNRLVVGPERDLLLRRVVCDRFLPAVDDPPERWPDVADGEVRPDGRRVARIRYRHRGAHVASWMIDGDRLEVELAEAARGVAPGQSLVLYDGELVLGGGRIREAR